MKRRSPIFFVYWSLIIHVAVLVALDVNFRREKAEEVFTNVSIEEISFTSTDISPQLSARLFRSPTSSEAPFVSERRIQRIAEIGRLDEIPLRREQQFEVLQEKNEIILDPVLAEDPMMKETLPEDAVEELEREETVMEPDWVEEIRVEPVRTKYDLDMVRDHKLVVRPRETAQPQREIPMIREETLKREIPPRRLERFQTAATEPLRHSPTELEVTETDNRIALDPLRTDPAYSKPIEIPSELMETVREKAEPQEVALSRAVEKRRQPKELEISRDVNVLPVVSTVLNKERKRNSVARNPLPLASHNRSVKPDRAARRKPSDSGLLAKRSSLSPIRNIELSKLMAGIGEILSGDHAAENGRNGQKATGGSSLAKYKKNRKPTYPEAAKMQGYQGTVLLRVKVLADGTPGEIQIHESSGYETLDNAAAKSVKKWKFHPATRDGEPIDSWVIIPIEFRLKRG